MEALCVFSVFFEGITMLRPSWEILNIEMSEKDMSEKVAYIMKQKILIVSDIRLAKSEIIGSFHGTNISTTCRYNVHTNYNTTCTL